MKKIFTKKFWSKKKIIWTAVLVVVVLLAGFFIFSKKAPAGQIQAGAVSKKDLQETVLATGQVVSVTDLNLSFQGSGIVRWIAAKEGAKVYQGQTLATLDQSMAQAQLTSAKGALAQAEANYEKLLEGAKIEDVRVYEDAVVSAQHDLDSSYKSALNTLNDSYTKIYNAYSVANAVYTNYFSASDQQGIKVQEARNNMNSIMQDVQKIVDKAESSALKPDIDSALASMGFALSKAYDDLVIIRTQCDDGVYYAKISSADKTSLDTQKGYINTASTSNTTAQQNIASQKIALQKAEHQLDLKKAAPTQAEIDASKAQVLSAQGQVDSAKASLNNLTITAPMSGTITEVNKKVGEQATSMEKVMVLQDIGNLHTEANVSEANIASVQVGQDVDYTFDALGPDLHFVGKILTINPASTVISGVVDYKVKASLDNIPDIKPGMTANMTILIAKKEGVLAVPSTAIINKSNGKFVRVIDDPKKMTYHEVQVQTGMQADGGMVEIISGLNENDQIVIYLKK